jgi:DNA-directed RNA polymerase specialized sigma24 family protein
MTLHLVQADGSAVSAETETAVKRSFTWVSRAYPSVDTALIANWAEEVAASMESRVGDIASPIRYAEAALKGRVHDWLRRAAAKEEPAGIGFDLERLAGTSGSFENSVQRHILFQQIKGVLNERDRMILFLLLEDKTSPKEIAFVLDISYTAAAKAIQRVKERIADALRKPKKHDDGGLPSRYCETKG